MEHSINRSRKKKKRKPKYGRIIISTLLFFGLMALLIKIGFDMFVKEHDTYLVDYGSLDIKDDVSAIVIRNEIIVKTNLKGSLTYYVNEGDRVIKGEPIAEVFNDGNIAQDTTATELEINQKQIEFDYNVLESDIMTLKNNILFAISQKDYAEIPSFKRELILKLQTREKLEGENKFLANRTSSYTERTVGEGYLNEGEKSMLNAPADGIVTFQIDGYEDFLNIDNIYNVNYDEVNTVSFAKQSVFSNFSDGSSALLKLVDQSTFYVLFSVSSDNGDTYVQGKKVLVTINGETLNGEVFDIFSAGSDTQVVIRLNDENTTFINDRKVNCTIVNDDFSGLKINIDSIVNSNNQNGVYRVMDDRKLAFVPIKIIGYDDDYAVVQADQFYDNSNGIVRTISASQEIIRNATAYREGDIIE